MGCGQSKAAVCSRPSKDFAAQKGHSECSEPPLRGLVHGDADVQLSVTPTSQPKPSPDSRQSAGSSSPSWEGSRGHRQLSPNIMGALHEYVAHIEDKLGRQPTLSTDAELNSQALPDTYVPAPRPFNEAQRQATVDAMNIIAAPANPYLYNLCRLAAQTLGTPLAWVLIADHDALQATAFHGMAVPHNSRGDRDSSMCVWGLVSDADLVVVEDIALDLRFLRHECCQWAKPLRFLGCAPLTAANGHRIGYMLLSDFKPRRFDAGMYHLFANLAALAMQEIEAGARGPLPEPELDSACKFSRQSMSMQIMLPSTAELAAGVGDPACTLICNAASPGWPLVHGTSTSAEILGSMPAACLPPSTQSSGASSPGSQQQSLWQLFGRPEGVDRIAEQMRTERHPRLVVVPPGGTLKPPEGMQYKLVIHSPTQDWPARYGPVTGIPPTAYLFQSKAAAQLCIVEVLRVPGSASQPAITSLYRNSVLSPARQAMADKDVFLGAQIGRGGYGKVYHSKYRGQDVAVKVIQDQSMQGSARVNIEVDVATELKHPNIIATLAYYKHEVPVRTLEGLRQGQVQLEHWIVMELCTRGSLQGAYERGWFQSAISKPGMTASPLAALVATAADIAQGMAYLHERNILHGDLTAGNVLLSADDADFRGFTAKVADFGLSRFISGQQIHTTTYGTVTHMPPELLVEGTLSKAGDTYAFGCLMWSMITGSSPWPNSSQMQVMMKVTLRGESLQVPDTAPPLLREIVMQCLHRQPEQRPTFQSLQAQLQDYYSQVCKDDELARRHPQSGRSSTSSRCDQQAAAR